MNIFNTKIGQLFIGGCGTQLGLLFTLLGLGATLLFCVVCASINVLTVSLFQPPADSDAPIPVIIQVTATPALEVVMLREQVDDLRGKVQSLREVELTPSPTPTGTPVPPPPQAIAMAAMGRVNLRGGPSEASPRLGRLELGESLRIVGRNADSSWWLVATPNNQFAWVADMAVTTYNTHNALPVVTIPILLVQPDTQFVATAAGPPADSTGTGAVFDLPTPDAPTINLPLPSGTPTAVAQAGRRFVQDTLGYKQLIRRLLLPTVSESFAPHGDRIAITEKIKLYTITTDGATKRVLIEDNEEINLVGGAVWSPDARYLAFIADRRGECDPCRVVGLIRMGDGSISYLESPSDSGTDKPRWTQDGQLLVTVFWDKVEYGVVYLYDTSGQSQEATGTYLLSSNHDGQKWFPWLPGKVWNAKDAAISNYYE